MTAKVLKDEGQSFESFFREHHRLVYRAAYSVTHNAHDAEDVVQTVFLKVLQLGEHSELARNVSGYLYRAAIHEALFILRVRTRRRVEKNIEDVDVAVETVPPTLEQARDAFDAMMQLSSDDIEILNLRYEQDYSNAEIAVMLSRSQIQVAVDLFRARGRLRKLLQPNCADARRRTSGRNLSTEGEQR